MTCAIIDDEPLAVKLLESYVAKTHNLTLIGTYTSAVEAISGLTKKQADVLFLDIQMPEVDGLSFARLMQNSSTQVIFTTAFSEYAVDSYKVSATDYLLKPITYEDFLGAVSKAQRRMQHPESGDTTPIRPQMSDTLFVKSDYKMVRLSYNDISYIEGLKDYVKIHVQGEVRSLLSLSAMRNLEAELPAPFIRVHRSFIVNMEKVTSVERTQLLIDDITIPISESYKDQVFNYIQERTLQNR